jgi:hypothetical protein
MGTWDEQLLHLRMLPGFGQDPHQKLRIENIAAVTILEQIREQPARRLDLPNELIAIRF